MQIILSSIALAFLTLLPLINPVGAVPLFCSLSCDGTPEYRRKMAFKTSLNVALILIVFLFIGKILLEFFGISLPVLKVAGGLIVAHTAWQMVTSQHKLTNEESSESNTKQDISFTPMAMPMLSGPGSIGVVIGMSAQKSFTSFSYYIGFVIGIILLGFLTYIILLVSLKVLKKLGTTGIGVLNRIMGFFILAIAVQLIFDGIMAMLEK